jgi:hypothetical protein
MIFLRGKEPIIYHNQTKTTISEFKNINGIGASNSIRTLGFILIGHKRATLNRILWTNLTNSVELSTN